MILSEEIKRLLPRQTSMRCGWSDHFQSLVHIGAVGATQCYCGERQFNNVERVLKATAAKMEIRRREQRTGDETV